MAVTHHSNPPAQTESHELSEVRSNAVQRPPSPGTLSGPEPQEEGQLDRAAYPKLISAGFSFFVAGVNDGSTGALIPYMIRDYNVNTAIVSSVYGANFLGWLFAGLSNTYMCEFLDLGAMLALGAAFQILAHALRSWDPPFGLFVVTFFLVSVGQAYQDTWANTFVAGCKGATHRWLAFIHAMYMAGCLTGPFISTAIATAGAASRWYLFYTVPVAFGVLNLALCLVAFRETVRIRTKQTIRSGPGENALVSQGEAETEGGSRAKHALNLVRDTLKAPSVWLLSLFYFLFLGASLTASGWVVEYLVVVRSGNLAQMGYVPAGFSGGCFLGRVLLAEPTHRFGERRMIFIYAALCVAFQLVFWLVPNIAAASVAISLVGLFSGPFFATGISVGTKLFSPNIRSTALSFVFVFAQLGGCVFPIMTGVIAASAGVKILQPALIILFAGTAVSWLLVPRPKQVDNSELHGE